MKKIEYFSGYKKEDKYFLSNILDKIEKFKKTKIMQCSSFLDERQLNLAVRFCDSLKEEYQIYRFHDACEKAILVFGEIKEPFVTCFKVVTKNKIRHQDVLGALFALGLRNDVIGDIFVEEEATYFMILSSLNDLIMTSFTKIAKENIEPVIVSSLELKEEHFEYFTYPVKSLRLDAILSKILHISRSLSNEIISNKKVFVNYDMGIKNNLLLKERDVLSIRGYGKYRIASIDIDPIKSKIRIRVMKYK